MDPMMQKLKQNGQIREDSPIISQVDGADYMFESPVCGNQTKCIISNESYSLLEACNIDCKTVGNILLLLCKQLGEDSALDLRHYNGGADGYVALAIIVGLNMCGNDETKFMESISQMSKDEVTSLFLNGNYIFFKSRLK